LLQGFQGLDVPRLTEWLRRRGADGPEVIGHGVQGALRIYRQDGMELLVKSAHGRGAARWLRRWMLRREHRAYQQLAEVTGVPRCYGLLEADHLVLEHLDAEPYRLAKIENPGLFYARLLELIQDVHRQGVAHGDIKGKNNVLVGPDEQPYLVDFGAASVAKPGFRPLHRWVYRVLAQMDYNSYVKLKYDRDYSNLAPADAALFHRTWIERGFRVLKMSVLRLRWSGELPVKQRVAHRPSVRPARTRQWRQRAAGAPGAPVRSGDRVSLRTFDGLHASADEKGRLAARTDRERLAFIMQIVARDGGHTADSSASLRFGDRLILREASSGRYVTSGAGGRKPLVVETDQAEARAVFTVIRVRLSPEGSDEIRFGDYFGLRSSDGRNLRYAADTDGELTASSPRSGSWESCAFDEAVEAAPAVAEGVSSKRGSV
jgi:predicted Ser/Thr protein kinase